MTDESVTAMRVCRRSKIDGIRTCGRHYRLAFIKSGRRRLFSPAVRQPGKSAQRKDAAVLLAQTGNLVQRGGGV